MKNRNRILVSLFLVAAILSLCSMEAFALTEDEVRDQVNAVGKEAVTGSIFVWFLCAIAFLKVSQKIDSFMSSLGINVGHTGGSMMSELMIAARGMSLARSGGMIGGGGSRGGSGGGEHVPFMKGGVVGAIGRSIERSAAQNATGAKEGGIGGKIYNSSVSEGGSFANRIIGGIATGRSQGTISGPQASDALSSYLGYTAMGEGAEGVPSFSNVEIGGGHIFATETTPEHPGGIAMGMYNTEQYMAPEGDYTTVTAEDGSTWYKQYAADAVERKPYMGEDGKVAYNESIVQRLPKIPQRKDRI